MRIETFFCNKYIKLLDLGENEGYHQSDDWNSEDFKHVTNDFAHSIGYTIQLLL